MPLDLGINALATFALYSAHIAQGVVIALVWSIVSVVVSEVLLVR